MREPRADYSCQQYERPNQPWVCGLMEAGHACAVGPTAAGGCPALGDCAPVRDGDRWQCNRSALRGGECDEGPTPDGGCGRVLRCHPVRSLRSKRGRFVAACTVFAAGALAIMLSSDWRDAAIAPGPLSQQHAQLLARGSAAANCAACHSAAERSVGGWVAATVVGHGSGPTQSELCMKCHDKTISPEFALAAHNVPAELLHKISQSRGGATAAAGELACATCHREHHGAAFNLTALNNAACQACHQERYHSFASDHPDFGAWPYERRTRIAFNHASHQGKHFAERKQTFDCRSCHVEDGSRAVQLTASYEAACATCHDDKIATSVAKGVPMLVVPTLDVEALKAAGHDIGAWPAAATGDFDGRLPPAMKLLVSADASAAKAMTVLGADFEFLDVDPDDENQLAACADLAKAIKELLADVSKRGPVAVRERLNAVLGREVSEVQVESLIAGLSVDTVRGAVAAWWPELASESNTWAGNSKLVGTGNVPYGPAGDWSRDDTRLSIRYQPVAHADPVLASWLAMLAETPGMESRPLELAMFKELSKPTAAGLCASCHSVEENGSGKIAINWQTLPLSRKRPLRGFTRFSHGPHLLLPQLSDCTECHAVNASAATATSYAGWNPHTFVSEFQPMSKRQCAECHTATAAGDACQSCHNYHVEVPTSWNGK